MSSCSISSLNEMLTNTVGSRRSESTTTEKSPFAGSAAADHNGDETCKADTAAAISSVLHSRSE